MRAFTAPFAPIPLDKQAWRSAIKLTRDTPFVLEIGAGVGYHAIQYAKVHPESRLVALERTSEKFARFQSRINGHSEKQCRYLYAEQADACQWVAQHLQPDELDAVFILYPNPYPKSKHKNKRWMFMPFMGKLINCMKPGATLTIATNIASYYADAKHELVDTWGLSCLNHAQLTIDNTPSAAARTHFEKKYLERGQVCYDLLFSKPL